MYIPSFKAFKTLCAGLLGQWCTTPGPVSNLAAGTSGGGRGLGGKVAGATGSCVLTSNVSLFCNFTNLSAGGFTAPAPELLSMLRRG